MQVEKSPGEMVPMRHGRPASLPKGLRVYAVGDIHGRADLLAQVFAHIDEDTARHPGTQEIEVFIGDYVDRGPDSAAVINQLVERSTCRKTVFLRGNHEALMLAFLENPSALAEWEHVGGMATLISYGLQGVLKADREQQIELCASFNRVLPPSHRNFLQDLRTSYACGDYFFVHAGVRPGLPLSQQEDQDLLWIRTDFLEHAGPFGKIVVHGHTPVMQPQILGNRINIDTGAFATGKLTCFAFQDDYVRSI
jgi:serine/threonine protein phosphatase 1